MLPTPFHLLSSIILFTQISHVLSFGCSTAPDDDIATSQNASIWRRDDTENFPTATCELGTSNPRNERSEDPEVFTSLSRRAPAKKTKKARLQEPGEGDEAFEEFMDGFVNKKGVTQLYIWPTKEQVQGWQINYGGKNIAIGATGVYKPFTNKPEKFVMQGLTGCTAIFVVSSHGIWAGHLWEGAKTVNGGGSFLHRFSDDDQRQRSVNEFKAVAVEIMGQATPPRQKEKRPLWKSLEDVKRDEKDPFGDDKDTEIFILTKAMSESDSTPMYAKLLDPLVKKFKRLFQGAEYTQRSYVPYDPSIGMETIRGAVGIQYTPYDHDGGDDDCTPQARVRMFYQNNQEPVIDKTWDATSGQVNNKKRRDACSRDDDWPIKSGYVAFGDSFAAGMGTGVTTTDSCRVGTANVGDLIYARTDRKDIDYQRKMCSGDTTTGLNRQIDEWKNPENTDLATVTAGGNDLGFSDIVWSCILAPNPIRWASTYRKWCKDAKAKANRILDDTSEDGIGPRLTAAYRKIVEKSTRDDFHLYVSGYPGGFFRDDNAQPVDCKNTFFNYLDKPAYCPHWYMPCYGSDKIYLTVALRQELNRLVVKLNDVTRAAVEKVNEEVGSDQVHFVDVGPYFDGHRWCEKMDDPDDHEPNEDRADTWYFLSGWKDFDVANVLGGLPGISDAVKNETNDVAEVNSLVESGGIELPNADSCQEDLGTDPDPYAKWLCMVSQFIADDPDGAWAEKLKEANADISAGEFNTESIGYWTPTRQIKTFHPRTQGMHAYRDSIIDAINKVQVSINEAPSPSSTSAPRLGSDPVCHADGDVPDHGIVDPNFVREASEDVCQTIGGKLIQPDTDPNKFVEERQANGVLYQYKVSWIEGCGSTRNKLPGTASFAEEEPTCQELFNKAFERCNNGGIGGYVDSSCARFTFTGGARADESE